MAAIALFGVVSYRALPVADLPTVDFPTLQVSASLPGADPATMASAVATPLERQFTTIAGLDEMSSVSALGATSITLQFDLNRNIDGAAVDVETAISEATPLLPPGMPNPPSFHKNNPSDYPIVFMGLVSDTLPMWVIDDYAETLVAQRISTINGVAQVFVSGQQKYAVHVQVDPRKMAARGIGINEVAQAVQNWNVNVPTGTLYGPHTAYNVQSSGQLMKAEDYRPMTVAWKNGKPVRLQDVAHVVDSVEDERTTSWMYTGQHGSHAISLYVMRQPGSNTIEVIDNIKKLIPVFNAQLPPAVRLQLRGDRSKNIRDAFHDIQVTMGVTMVLVIVVIYMFLRNFSATMIPAMALPLSLVGTFTVMYVLHYSLDNMSMMALILCVGFVVDDAIVMLENIVRHLERGEKPFQAALNGSREIGFTIVSMTLSLTAVFIPVLFMSGILGRLFKEFAVTISVAVLISGLISITLTPMLCSKFLRRQEHHKEGRLYRWSLHLYDVSLRWVLRHRPVMAATFFIVLGITGYLYVIVPKGFIPDQDNDQMYVNTEAAQGTSFQEMVALTERLSAIISKDPAIETFQSSVGGSSSFGGASGGNTGRIFVQLLPRSKRPVSAAEVIARLRPKIANIPGMKAYMSLPPVIRVGGHGSAKSSYELTVRGPDTKDLYVQADKLQTVIAKLPAVADVNSDLQIKSPRVNVEIDRDKAAALQINAQDIESALYNGFGPSWISTIYAPVAQYKVLLELLPKYQQHSDSVSELYVKSATGQLVPLEAVTKLTRTAGPLTLNHTGQLPSVTISFNLKPGVALGDAVARRRSASTRWRRYRGWTLPSPRMSVRPSGRSKWRIDSPVRATSGPDQPVAAPPAAAPRSTTRQI